MKDFVQTAYSQMFLKDAFDLAFTTRDSWVSGSGASTARINSEHVLRILGLYQEVEKIETLHFTKLTKALLDEGYKPATVNKITSVLSTLLKELRQLGYKLDDVKYKRQKETQGRPEFFKEDEVEDVLDVAKRRNDFMLLHDSIVFALKTGCRQGEMLQLTEDDVDFDRRTITFLDTKNGSDHVIKMHDELVGILERRVAQRIDARMFPWRDKDQLLRAFKKVMEEADLKSGRVWHTLRHTTATWLCERGVPLRAVMGVLNHSNVKTTLRYAKASDKSVAAAIDML